MLERQAECFPSKLSQTDHQDPGPILVWFFHTACGLENLKVWREGFFILAIFPLLICLGHRA